MEPRHVPYADYDWVAFQRHRFSTQGFADLRQRLATSIEAAGLWVLQEIDAQALLPAADPAALLAAPQKVGMLALPDATIAMSWAL